MERSCDSAIYVDQRYFGLFVLGYLLNNKVPRASVVG
jgi:hypothetical protein